MSLPDPGVLDAVRRRRGDLDDALLIVRDGLVADRAGPRRVAALCAGLRQLRADLYEHVAATEGPDGLYDEVRRADPRFEPAVWRLRDEHTRLGLLLDDLLADIGHGPQGVAGWPALQPQVVELLAMLGRHRSRDAQLAYDAGGLDLGGQD
ncbi:hypothetical protein [Embleya scabrispora]|jgi:hypothetical protein|uniref:hypothetical protein n=1 Tax=Embleya scabrispora TaxID=159449 RepID=UPI00036A39D4|nr:hypothetical protein [Embleya scabrispora]MYS80457.1 hypothetical protein [Streptomyces sp. SID5474]